MYQVYQFFVINSTQIVYLFKVKEDKFSCMLFNCLSFVSYVTVTVATGWVFASIFSFGIIAFNSESNISFLFGSEQICIGDN